MSHSLQMANISDQKS